MPPAVPRSLVGPLLAVSIIRAMEVFDLETARRIEEMEQAQIVSSERMRLARQLHDGSLQKVYTAGLLVESARKHAPAEGPVSERLARAETAQAAAPERESLLDVLKRRYALGEITLAQFEEMKGVLGIIGGTKAEASPPYHQHR